MPTGKPPETHHKLMAISGVGNGPFSTTFCGLEPEHAQTIRQPSPNVLPTKDLLAFFVQLLPWTDLHARRLH